MSYCRNSEALQGLFYNYGLISVNLFVLFWTSASWSISSEGNSQFGYFGLSGSLSSTFESTCLTALSKSSSVDAGEIVELEARYPLRKRYPVVLVILLWFSLYYLHILFISKNLSLQKEKEGRNLFHLLYLSFQKIQENPLSVPM